MKLSLRRLKTFVLGSRTKLSASRRLPDPTTNIQNYDSCFGKLPHWREGSRGTAKISGAILLSMEYLNDLKSTTVKCQIQEQMRTLRSNPLYWWCHLRRQWPGFFASDCCVSFPNFQIRGLQMGVHIEPRRACCFLKQFLKISLAFYFSSFGTPDSFRHGLGVAAHMINSWLKLSCKIFWVQFPV